MNRNDYVGEQKRQKLLGCNTDSLITVKHKMMMLLLIISSITHPSHTISLFSCKTTYSFGDFGSWLHPSTGWAPHSL